MQFALTFNSPSSNHLIETFGISKLEFLTLVKGVIQSIRFACSVRKPSGSPIERLYMVLYASSSIRAQAAAAGGIGTSSGSSAFLLCSAPHEKLRGGRALCLGVALRSLLPDWHGLPCRSTSRWEGISRRVEAGESGKNYARIAHAAFQEPSPILCRKP